MIESQALDGFCLNSGCIPCKALLSVVEFGEKVKKAGLMGLQISGPVTLYGLGKAQATGETTGWCKVIADASGGDLRKQQKMPNVGPFIRFVRR